jgi:hypothetical protein
MLLLNCGINQIIRGSKICILKFAKNGTELKLGLEIKIDYNMTKQTIEGTKNV